MCVRVSQGVHLTTCKLIHMTLSLSLTQEALRLTVDPDSPAYPDVLILLAMLVALRWATYYVLRAKTSTKQKGL